MLLAACGGSAPKAQSAEAKGAPKAADEKPAATALRRATTDTIRVHIQNLADDTFQGRRPGTEGGRQAEIYIAAQMEHLGLSPAGDDGGFRQHVPMRGVTLKLADAGFALVTAGGPEQPLKPGEQIVATSFGEAGASSTLSDLVFVGYGVTAPEYEWDDYAGLDVKGKTVVAFVGDPPVTDGRFAGNALTYYGRWSYKFERALKAGAAGCLVIHEPKPASYGWDVVRSSWSGERFGLSEKDGSPAPALGYQGWLHAAAAEALATAAGSTLERWHADALQADFVGRPLAVKLRANFETTERSVVADNIVGAIRGRDNADQSVVITAHWDHLGLAENPKAGSGVFNGAVDNASGIAGMLAAAASLVEYAKAGRGPARTVVFLATTAEEQGLLGSRYFASHPTVPASGIVGAANFDSMNVHGRTNSVVVVGAGQSTLEDTLADVVQTQGRHTIADDRPEGGGYYRSDQFSFARQGIPALYFRGSTDMVDGGTEAGAALAKLRSERYHTVSDEYDPTWSLEGTLQDVEALVELVVRVANADSRPAWKPASEFAKAP